jgi:hypothetical protein
MLNLLAPFAPIAVFFSNLTSALLLLVRAQVAPTHWFLRDKQIGTWLR